MIKEELKLSISAMRVFNHIFSKREKKQMILISIFCSIIDFITIYFVDLSLDLNIIFSILLSYIISFLIFLIPSSLFIFYFEMSDVQLDKDEIREEKLNNLFRKLF
jgi:hypothetical protein